MLGDRSASFAIGLAGAAILLAATTAAKAGGFAIREQSAHGLGAAYAGVAAGGSLSSMFWNPATMTQMPGIQSESVISGIFPYSANSPTGGTLAALGGTGNIAHDALAPAGYFSWQVNPQIWIGASFNAPFGLTETFPDNWAGRDYGAGGSHLSSYNFTPSVAYRINDWISVGAGVQIQYANATMTTGYGALLGSQTSISGAGWGFGFTAGVTLKPTQTTTIGIGYRSAIDQDINGTLQVPAAVAAFSTPGSASTTIRLPDTVSVGLRQKLTPQLTALATVEWANWSRIGTSAVLQPGGAQATEFNGRTAAPVNIAFEYKDGWFFSLGAEYELTDQFTLRGGVGYEKSPITDQVRIPILEDNDRTWLSVGGSYKVTNKLTLDFAYSHLFVKSTPIDVVAGNPSFNGAVTYDGTVDSHIDIVSVGLKYRWDNPAPAPVERMYVK